MRAEVRPYQGAVAAALRPLDNKWLLLLLQDAGLSAEQAFSSLQELRTAAAKNATARAESRLDTHTARTERLNSSCHLRVAALALLSLVSGQRLFFAIMHQGLPVHSSQSLRTGAVVVCRCARESELATSAHSVHKGYLSIGLYAAGRNTPEAPPIYRGQVYRRSASTMVVHPGARNPASTASVTAAWTNPATGYA